MRTIAIGLGLFAHRVIQLDDIELLIPPNYRSDIQDGQAEVLRKAISAACCNSTLDYDIPSNREERRRNQPFYRGLKKYRKP